jgi:hypothetical protein
LTGAPVQSAAEQTFAALAGPGFNDRCVNQAGIPPEMFVAVAVLKSRWRLPGQPADLGKQQPDDAPSLELRAHTAGMSGWQSAHVCVDTVSGNIIKSFGLTHVTLQLKLPNEIEFRGSRRHQAQRTRSRLTGTPPDSRSQRRLVGA